MSGGWAPEWNVFFLFPHSFGALRPEVFGSSRDLFFGILWRLSKSYALYGGGSVTVANFDDSESCCICPSPLRMQLSNMSSRDISSTSLDRLGRCEGARDRNSSHGARREWKQVNPGSLQNAEPIISFSFIPSHTYTHSCAGRYAKFCLCCARG